MPVRSFMILQTKSSRWRARPKRAFVIFSNVKADASEFMPVKALGPIVSPSHPFSRLKLLDPQKLDGQSIVMHERGSATRDIVDTFIRRNNLSVLIALELSNNEAIKRAVEEGAGGFLLSEQVVREGGKGK